MGSGILIAGIYCVLSVSALRHDVLQSSQHNSPSQNQHTNPMTHSKHAPPNQAATHSGCTALQTHGGAGIKYDMEAVKAEKLQPLPCDPEAKYRTPNGVCNNLQHPMWGTTMEQHVRLMEPAYDDGFSKPRLFRGKETALPSARKVSTGCFKLNTGKRRSPRNNQILMQWGQFADHDITLTPMETAKDCCVGLQKNGSYPDYETDGPCFPIPIPEVDRYFCTLCMEVQRSRPSLDEQGVRQQINAQTSFLDGSAVYGPTAKMTKNLRQFSGGRMRTSPGKFLPLGNSKPCVIQPPATACFVAGDPRVDEFSGQTTLQTIWLREHNRIAKALEEINPFWDDETLFQESRRIVGALIQHIHYKEWLPSILGDDVMEIFGLSDPYEYDPFVKPNTINSFSTAAFRFGHSLLIDRYGTFDNPFQCTSRMFFRPSIILEGNGAGLDTLVETLLDVKSAKTDIYFSRGINDRLFDNVTTPGVSMDLPALNIQRGRDHGLPPYSQFLKQCRLIMGEKYMAGYPDCTHEVYGDTADVDLFVGGINEKPVEGGMVGHTFACIIATQFRNLRNGDRFFYENREEPTGFTEDQLNEILKVGWARVICDNTAIVAVQPHAFQIPAEGNEKTLCEFLPQMDMSKWKV